MQEEAARKQEAARSKLKAVKTGDGMVKQVELMEFQKLSN
jgi:hypothetical protein